MILLIYRPATRFKHAKTARVQELVAESPGHDASLRDVVVIGGGPAGSTVAALLAARGKTVTLIEKDRHPRFHIGESLLPFNVPLLDRLGVKDAVERMGMPKYGIEFVSPDHDKPSLLEFGDGWHKDMSYSFQVRRSEFDKILFDNAKAKGAEAIEDCRVTAVDFPAEGGGLVTTAMADGEMREFRGRFVVDASGRDTFLASRLNVKQRNRRHESAAVFGHFTNAERLQGRDEGHISIFWFARGWFWFIPLSDGTTSVGAVSRPDIFKNRDGDMTALLKDLIASCPALAHRLRNATLTGPATGTGNYSYDADSVVGPSYLMVGDAGGFIDPVFSTGVYLAMNSGFLAADAIETCLDRPEQAAQVLQHFEQQVKANLARFSWFIYRITSPTIRTLFMAPRNYFRISEAVLSLLAGDIAPKSPIRLPLALFKALFYVQTALVSLLRPIASSVKAFAPRQPIKSP
jgi:flavin-dependent dehydrogenase